MKDKKIENKFSINQSDLHSLAIAFIETDPKVEFWLEEIRDIFNDRCVVPWLSESDMHKLQSRANEEQMKLIEKFFSLRYGHLMTNNEES